MQRMNLELKAVTFTHGSVSLEAEQTLQCTEYLHQVEVDDVKIDIKDEPYDNATTDDKVRAPSPKPLWIAKEEPRGLQSAQSATFHPVQQTIFQMNRLECYYVKSLLVQCPACDTSYRGGRQQLPRLIEHVKKNHKKNCSRFIKSIKTRYRVKKNCDCFACLMQREVNP